jgi:hypothetical protein
MPRKKGLFLVRDFSITVRLWRRKKKNAGVDDSGCSTTANDSGPTASSSSYPFPT